MQTPSSRAAITRTPIERTPVSANSHIQLVGNRLVLVKLAPGCLLGKTLHLWMRLSITSLSSGPRDFQA